MIIHTTPAQDKAVQAYIDSKIRNPGEYNLYSNNCAITVENALNAANIKAPDDILPDNLFKWVKNNFNNHKSGL